MKTKFVVEFAKQTPGRHGVVEFGTAKGAAKCAAEIAFVLGAHGDPQTGEHWYSLTRGRSRASWECSTGAWVTVTRVVS